MHKHGLAALAVCALAIPAFCADEPFAGTWKFNKSKSDLKGQSETIASLGNNKYKLTYGDISFDITADGTDQPSLPGMTLAIQPLAANKWQIVSKTAGKSYGTGIWTLSQDGNSISDDFKGTRADGTPNDSHATLKRTAGTQGFAGTWMLEDVSFNPSLLVIAVSGKGNLNISYPSNKSSLLLTMDGKDCTVEGPQVPKGATASAKRAGPDAITVTNKLSGKLMDTTEWKVSADGKTLTQTEHDAGVPKASVSVYDRQ